MGALHAAAHEGCAMMQPRFSSQCNQAFLHSHGKIVGFPARVLRNARQQRAGPRRRQRCTRHLPCASGSSDDSVSTSAFNEVAALDKLIDLLRGANGQQELTQLVAENLLAFDQKFWIRLATRADVAQNSEEKDTLKNLANVMFVHVSGTQTVMHIVDAIVKKTSSQLADSGRILQEILAAAANERGEWEVPLAKEKAEAMRAAMEERSQHLDEALLSNAFAWMRKASADQLDGMVALLQKLLQLYAARALSGGASAAAAGEISEGSSAEAVLERIVASDEEQWDNLLQQPAVQQVGEEAMLSALRKKMEVLVLSLPSGSYAQRVQAEYLKELEGRAQAAFQTAKAP